MASCASCSGSRARLTTELSDLTATTEHPVTSSVVPPRDLATKRRVFILEAYVWPSACVFCLRVVARRS